MLMRKKLKQFTRNRSGAVMIMFGLVCPILVILFSYVNNYAVWNDLFQFTKGASKSASQSVGKQFFSRCIATGNTLNSCATAGTASNVSRTIMQEMIQDQVDKNFPQFNYNVNVTIDGTPRVTENYIHIRSRVALSNYGNQLIMPNLFGNSFPDEVVYQTQTVINLHFKVIGL